VNSPRLQPSLDRWAADCQLSDAPVVVRFLSEGETNQSYLIEVSGEHYVLRLDRPEGNHLGIDREREFLIWEAVAKAGIAPAITYKNDALCFVVYRYQAGRQWTSTDFKHSSQLERLKQLIDRYQTIELDLAPRNYHRYLLDYWSQITEAGLADSRLIQAWKQFLPVLTQFQASDWQPCLSHHDLIPENIIETENGLVILDWEYAALGHPDLDWNYVTGEQHSEIAQVIHWMDHLWTLLNKHLAESNEF